jgi:protein phosphatase
MQRNGLLNLSGFSGNAVFLRFAARSDLGRHRENNEDSFLLADLTPPSAVYPRTSEEDIAFEPPGPDGYVVGPKGYLLLVADGMGGAAGGEVASEMAAHLVFEQLLDSWVFAKGSSNEVFQSALEKAIEYSNERIHRRATREPALRGMGTTVTAVGILGGEYVVGQVGDSRAYLVGGDRAIQITRDQTLANRLLEEGSLSEAEAQESPMKHKLLQALGPSPSVEVALTTTKASSEDTLVLCTDGLTELVSSEEIFTTVRGSHDPAVICEDLVALANSRGGPDNITVIVAKLVES